jgi:hypothetical protein
LGSAFRFEDDAAALALGRGWVGRRLDPDDGPGSGVVHLGSDVTLTGDPDAQDSVALGGGAQDPHLSDGGQVGAKGFLGNIAQLGRRDGDPQRLLSSQLHPVVGIGHADLAVIDLVDARERHLAAGIEPQHNLVVLAIDPGADVDQPRPPFENGRAARRGRSGRRWGLADGRRKDQRRPAVGR